MVSARKHAFIALSFTSLVAIGCSSSSGAIPLGAEGENCNADGTCNAGLTCQVDLCVAGGIDAGAHDATLVVEASTGLDAPAHEASTDATVGTNEAGTDAAGRDAALSDASLPDAVTSDASPHEAGAADASALDGAICGKVSTLHPPKLDAGPGSIYCPFSAVTDGGSNEYCTAGTEHCCETPSGNATPSACQPAATACVSGSVDWGCEDPVVDCANAATPVCCAPGASIGLGTSGCGNFAHTMKSTTCVAAGSCTGITMCTSNAECPAGQTCTPFEKAGNAVGGCM